MPFTSRIPLFPLGLVLFPEVLLPLHIFEERYKTMIGECLEKDSEFGIIHSSGSKTQSRGCTARVIRVLKRYPDGRMDILTKGERRFVVRDFHEEKPCLEGTVEFFDDDQEEPRTGEMEELADEGIDFMMRIEEIDVEQIPRDIGKNVGVKEASFLIASCQGFTADEKQAFLEMTSTLDRLKKAVSALRKMTERATLSRDIKKIVGGNGDVYRLVRRLS